MQFQTLIFVVMGFSFTSLSPAHVHAQGLLTGVPRLACEATLCLAASGGAPGECKPSLKKYFSIEILEDGKYQPGKTLNARKAFLQICPGTDSLTISRVNTSKRLNSRKRDRNTIRPCEKGEIPRHHNPCRI